MTLESVLSRVAPALTTAGVPYMVTGSVASSAHGQPRSTRDLDIVIAPTAGQLRALLQAFPPSNYYADKDQAMQALAARSQFNVIDFATGWKIDFIVADASEWGRTAMARRRLIEVEGQRVYVASPEDVVIAKLRWAKMGASPRQLQDAAGVLITQRGNLDMEYIGRWARELQVENEWRAVRDSVPRPQESAY